MAIASIEIGRAYQGQMSSINGPCRAQAELTVTSGATTTTSAFSDIEPGLVARISTDSTGCYVAIGTTPDPTATTESSGVTTARRWLPAAASIELPFGNGQKVAVRGL